MSYFGINSLYFSSTLQYFSSILQYFSSTLQYLIHQLVRLALNVPTQYSKFGKVIRNNPNQLLNCALRSDLKSTVITMSFSFREHLIDEYMSNVVGSMISVKVTSKS